MSKYEMFTKEELIEMLERKVKSEDFWKSRKKDADVEYKELARCYNELWNSGETKTDNVQVSWTLRQNGIEYDWKSQTFHAPIIIVENEEEETEKKVFLRDIIWITNEETPIDLCMQGKDESFMSVETPFLNGICLIPEAFLGMEVVEINTTEDSKECRFFVTIKA